MGTKLIVGLGNPTKKYDLTRHNIGFMFIDILAAYYDASPFITKFNGLFTYFTYEGFKVLLLKPQTYMNLSGSALMPAMQFFKLKPEDIFVVHDDIDLDLGKMRLKNEGGHGGHNGVRHIIQSIGSKFNRLKIGIGRGQHPQQSTANYVLETFTKQELEELEPLFLTASKKLPLLFTKTPNDFVSQIMQELKTEKN